MEGQQQPVMATPIAAEGAAYPGQYPGTYAAPPGQYPGAQPFSGGYQTTGGQQGYAQPPPQGYAPQYGAPAPQYAPQYGAAPGYGVAAVPAGAYPQQVVYVQPGARVAYGYTYGERARMVYWGSPYARILTVVFIIMVVVGIILTASSASGCGSGCTASTCVASATGDEYPCTCRGGTTCENEEFAAQGKAGSALISIGVVALLIQSCIACGCCGSCCMPPQPVVVQRPPPMMVASAQPVYAPPMSQPQARPPPQGQNPPMQTGY